MKKLRRFVLLSGIGFLTALSACGGGSSDSASASKPTTPKVIVAYGDSLTHGGAYVTPDQLWVRKMATQIQADGIDSKASVTVVNQSISGETTTQALARLPGVLAAQRPTHIFLAHGTNDIWWECPGCYARTQQNLQQMANLATAAGAKVIMTDFTFKIRGDAEAQAFSAMYSQVAKASNGTYLQIVAGIPLDGTNYHPELVHLRDVAQEALKNNAVRALYATLK